MQLGDAWVGVDPVVEFTERRGQVVENIEVATNSFLGLETTAPGGLAAASRGQHFAGLGVDELALFVAFGRLATQGELPRVALALAEGFEVVVVRVGRLGEVDVAFEDRVEASRDAESFGRRIVGVGDSLVGGRLEEAQPAVVGLRDIGEALGLHAGLDFDLDQLLLLGEGVGVAASQCACASPAASAASNCNGGCAEVALKRVGLVATRGAIATGGLAVGRLARRGRGRLVRGRIGLCSCGR